jgi:hypothetical protein
MTPRRISVTMTEDAAERFLKALSYAESIIQLRAEELADSEGTSRRVQTAVEHAEWLRWGYGRTSAADACRDDYEAFRGGYEAVYDGELDEASVRASYDEWGAR